MSDKVFHLFKQGTDAIATNQGFYFQYIVTLEQWLFNYINNIDEDIYCEYEDDIFQENQKDNTRKFTQVKCYSGNFNLQDKAVLESLVHFYDLYLTHNNEATVEFVFEANCNFNAEGTSEGAKLLVEWVTNQKNVDNKLLRRLSTFLKNKINEFIDKRFETFEKANKEDKTSLAKAESKMDEILDEIGSSDFKKFIKSVAWKFDDLDKDLAIDKRKESCYDLIPTVLEFEKDKEAEVLFALLLNEVVTCSTKEKEHDRCLTNQLFKEKIDTANTSQAALKNIDKRTLQMINSLEGIAKDIRLVANETEKQITNKALAKQEELKKLEAYYESIKKAYNKEVFQDKLMTLASIYVQPRISIHEHFLTGRDEKGTRSKVFFKLKGYKNAYTLIKDFAEGNIKSKKHLKNTEANVMIMLGYPGQGKTSMCTHYLHNSIDSTILKENKVFIVKLREITNVKGLLESPMEQLLKEVKEECRYIKKDDFEKSLIILDGLDELTMKEGMKGTHVEELCDVLELKASKYNCKILITSRYGYINIEKLSEEKYIVAQIDLMTKEEQYVWCDNYNAIYPKSTINKRFIDSLYIDHKLSYLKELLSQPLLLQLMAMANISLDKEQIKNKAEIYARLFTNLIKRRWSEEGQINLLSGIDEDALRSYLQVLALEIHKSENEYIRKNDLEKLEETKLFLKKLHKGQSLNDCLKRLMISFYMNEVKKEKKDIDEADNYRNYAIEFLHKSLHEYLAAERIWELFKLMAIKFGEDDFKIADLSDVFKYIGSQLSPKGLTHEIRADLSSIIINDKSDAKAIVWERLNYFLPDLSRFNFINNNENQRNNNIIESGINFCIPYLEILAVLTNNLNKKCRPVSPEFCNYLRIINWKNYNINLSFLTFSSVNFLEISLGYSTLIEIDLSNANLNGAYLRAANLRKANLKNTTLRQSYLIQADLTQGDLTWADLEGANLIRANLSNANLTQVDLEGANLTRANLSNANLTHADLRGATLTHANLNQAIVNNPKFLTKEYLYENNILGAEYLLQKYRLIEVELKSKDVMVLYKIFEK
jgi:uncharacterized protein YjbI with pentapeptide repeats